MADYAAFIMTYRRPVILKSTIHKILDQTFPPSKILIVDNDVDRSAKPVVNEFPEANISYFAVGYNSGPAGAATHGLQILFEEGWEWVLWMDDNDPPQFPDVIENIFNIPKQYSNPGNIGMIGAVGVYFDKIRAKTVRVPDKHLKGILEVDNIAGNMLPIVHRRVFQNNIFPDTKLFFGFEELDFSLSVKRGGFAVLVSGEEMYRHRKKANRLNFNRKLYAVKKINNLWREYYSVRNVTFILKYKENSFIGLASMLFRVIAKSLIGYRWGLKYGSHNMKYMLSGFINGFRGRMGKKNF